MLGRRIPFHQIAMATILGVLGGLYVYRPMFEPPKESQRQKVEDKADINS